ncbi:hypothetical protein SLU01_19070 [Sporosarcina luteola]|uniref:Uncharacterized protein n=1 Tax=Sporosarcina luteola TaxID=582850 RepID=A0A511Z828_9BACL|nr:hypothetical protein [Sporosarcina luteola]GEN83595.1 hypothetical protein SLU01_19070 [Sporosarcina luteola]
MNHLDELIDLTQQLVSVMDDMEGGIISTRIFPVGGEVENLCRLEFFLKNFSTFDVLKRQSDDRPLELKTEIEGVHFHTFVKREDLHLIEDYLPEGWFRPIPVPVEFIQVDLGQIKNPSALACE